MSLATRCPACSTVFRVVQDQLRVSEGWVRCGRCAEVFNAVEHMVEVPAGVGAPTPTESTAERPSEGAAEWHEPSAQAGPAVESDLALDIDSGASAPQSPLPEFDPGPPVQVDPPGGPSGVLVSIDDDERRSHPAPAVDSATSSMADEPSFLRQGSRDDPWARPQARRALWAVGALMTVVLCVQVVVEYRNLLVARAPALSPAFEGLCSWLGCRIEPPRWIEAIVVDSSGLVRVEGTQTYRFSAVLRNRAALALAMPALDLTLTDSTGQVIARRVLLAADLGSRSSAVAPMAEVPLQATLAVATVSGTAVAGYTIEFFYP
jgi:predicted Zn finger-like uncharacterized protein